jgi:ABC-2 type transport system ATP-binding protein
VARALSDADHTLSAAGLGPKEAPRAREWLAWSAHLAERHVAERAQLGAAATQSLRDGAASSALVRDRILEAKSRGATIVLNSHQLPEVERVCDRVAFLDGGRVTKTETLRGTSATRRRGLLRVPAERTSEAAACLAGESLTPRADSDGSLRFVVASDEDMARAVRAVAVAGIPIYEARSSAELEELFATEAAR